jgi:hypothetical protein
MLLMLVIAFVIFWYASDAVAREANIMMGLSPV